MFETVVLSTRSALGEAAIARDLLEAFQLPTDAMRVLQVRRLIAQHPTFGDALIQTEAAQFVDRVRSSGWSIADGPLGAPIGDPAVSINSPPHVQWVRDYIPRIIPPGHRFTANVRFRNAGQVTLRHAPPGNTAIAQCWLHTDGRRVNEAEDVRTPLPLDLLPGQELTFPIWIAAPPGAGRHRLRLLMVQEGVGWMAEDAIDIFVTLRPGVWPEMPPEWRVDTEKKLDYGADHMRGLQIMRDWLASLNVQRARVLEVGGNAYPIVAEIEGELHNIDVDLLGLQIGCLVQDRMEAAHPSRRVRQVCADANDLPYVDGYFDAVVMFATLHHFPDPAFTLARLAQKLRPGGFVGLFCEPVGHVHAGAVDPDYLRELKRGVNEQSFVLREWAHIFRAAKLRVAEAVVDFNSLKVRLVPLYERPTGAGP